MLLDTTSTIETPERVRFRHRVAGPGRRAAAWGIDVLIQAFALSLAGAVAAGFGVLGLGGAGMGAWLLGLFFVQWFYGAIFETVLAGRTPGKWAMRLRVVTGSGAPARLPQFVLRNLLRGADFLPAGYGVGVAVMTVDPSLRRLGDLVAGTVVVDERPTTVLDRAPISPPVSDAERQALPARVELTRDELAAIEAWLRRRSQLTPERAEELAALFAPAVAGLGVDAPTAGRAITLAYARATGLDRTEGAA